MVHIDLEGLGADVSRDNEEEGARLYKEHKQELKPFWWRLQ